MMYILMGKKKKKLKTQKKYVLSGARRNLVILCSYLCEVVFYEKNRISKEFILGVFDVEKY